MTAKTLFLAASLTALVAAQAQAQTPAGPIVKDARSTLAPGFHDGGQAAWNMQLLSNAPTPKGFTNEAWTPGTPPPPRRPGAPPAAPGAAVGGGPSNGVAMANTDIVFQGDRLFMGNFQGFMIYDLKDRDRPKLLTSVVCPGGQADLSVFGRLLFLSTETRNARRDCGMTPEAAVTPFMGVRIFDIGDLADIRQVAAVETCRGSHTNTLIVDPKEPGVVYVYSQGLSAVRPASELAGCSDKSPSADPNTSLYSIDLIKAPLAAPQTAAVVASPRLFADARTGAPDGLWKGGDHPNGGQTETRPTDHCHDITLYAAVGLGAAGCAGNGLLLDIRDPKNPKRLGNLEDGAFWYWHGAIFSNDGSKVVFTDEWGGGAQPRCRANDPADWGGDVVVDIKDGRMTPRAYYKVPGAQAFNENCVAHNGGLIPIPGRDVAVQGFYSGGLTVFDFTDSAHPREIAYFDRGPIDPTYNYTSGHWAVYWRNGRIYAPEIARGLDVLKLTPSEHLTANEIAAAELVLESELNPQSQQRYVWTDKPVVARAYIDQLVRGGAITAATASAWNQALDKPGSVNAALAARVKARAKAAAGRDKERFEGVARILVAAG